ncbi:hypothetical protein SAMN05444161_5738 [Rhizobiales bacterium GAS191]|nr:hypothetical protein SAMN05519103_04930 [Rhizobiales bacterium GAS113]SEE43093.1 hypothetical protein SAMN05444161_5738 [Rhizobiales bacterium GAS191]
MDITYLTVPTAFPLLIALIVATPVIAFIDGPVVHGLVAAAAAAAIAAVARASSGSESERLWRIARPFVRCLAIPAIWMAIQAVPMPFRGLSHSIWSSAEAALGKALTGSISVDPGATLIALARYLSVTATIFAAAAVTIDRRRAEWVLFSLAGATTAMAAILVVQQLASMSLAGEGQGAGTRTALAGGSSLGVILGLATTIRALERHETRRGKSDMPLSRLALQTAMGIAATVICWWGLLAAATPQEIFAAACGFAMMALVLLIRRLRFGSLASMAVAAVAMIVAVAMANARPTGSGDLTLRYAHASGPLVSLAERMVADSGWAGSGAGGLAALTPIYRTGDELAVEPSAPTSAAEIAIGLGFPALWMIAIMVLMAAGLLLRGVMQRRRDSVYPAAGASAAVLLTLEAFTDASALGTAVTLLAAAILGLGIAQSVGRSSQWARIGPSAMPSALGAQ